MCRKHKIKKVAFIAGITGKGGDFFKEFVLEKGCDMHSIKRFVSLLHKNRMDHLNKGPRKVYRSFYLRHGKMAV